MSARTKENWQNCLMEIGDTVGHRLRDGSVYYREIVGWHDQGVVVLDPATFECMVYTTREINQAEIASPWDWYIA